MITRRTAAAPVCPSPLNAASQPAFYFRPEGLARLTVRRRLRRARGRWRRRRRLDAGRPDGRPQLLIRGFVRLRFVTRPRASAAAATPAATTAAPLTALFVATCSALAATIPSASTATSRSPRSPSSCCSPTAATPAATLALLWSRRANRRGLRRGGHHLDPGTEVGIHFDDPDLLDLRHRTLPRSAAARAAPETRAADRHATRLLGRHAVRWRGCRGRRHRDVVFFFSVGLRRREHGSRGFRFCCLTGFGGPRRLFFVGLVNRDATDGLLYQPERVSKREPGLCGRCFGWRFAFLRRSRLAGSGRRFFSLRRASLASAPAAATATAASSPPIVRLRHRRQCRPRRRAFDLGNHFDL